VVSAVTIANAPVVINNHLLLLVNVSAIARTVVARTIDATTRKATLGITLGSPVLHLSLTPTKLHREKAQ